MRPVGEQPDRFPRDGREGLSDPNGAATRLAIAVGEPGGEVCWRVHPLVSRVVVHRSGVGEVEAERAGVEPPLRADQGRDPRS